MKKIYYLETCNTCQRILKELNLPAFVEQREIKSEPMNAAEIDAMAKLAGSYEALFSRRARKYRELGLQDQSLSEKDYRSLLLKEYTFLKRPVLVLNDAIFVGNSAATVKEAAKVLTALEK